MYIRDSEINDRWWKATRFFPTRKIALIEAQAWADRVEARIRAEGIVHMDYQHLQETLQSTRDPHAFEDAIFYLLNVWGYYKELEKQIEQNGGLNTRKN